MAEQTLKNLEEHAREMLALYLEAEKAVLLNQSYTIGGQQLTRANLLDIRKGRLEWETKLNNLLGCGPRRVRQVIPMGFI